ncbi:hypothetical protein [Caldovatus aquaticus]|uniref:Uncharacterized protein n=1 Tax=Caldovatus aquaticus TaxID=2865671 RepID=A0ABS7F0I3_9PROT|nr:hypothetical protein [Caldovatus aquaticus]MBW8268311.1 hypothetical protein [Caldovatus aquaticus]
MPFDRTNPNLALWLREMPTDPSFEGRPVVRPFTRGGGFRGSAINGTYLVMRLTQAFGPVGWGWGYEVLSDDVVPGAPVYEDGKLLGHESVQRTRIRFWYYPNGRPADLDNFTGQAKRAEFEQVGQTTYVLWRRPNPEKRQPGRFETDEEAWKKSLTDAISKAASHIGFAADVHLGLWDDNKYVNDRAAESEQQQRALDQAAAAEGAAEARRRAQEIADELARAETLAEVTRLRGEAIALRPMLKRHGLADVEATLGAAVRDAQQRVGALERQRESAVA